jgi:hypothetical protein
VRDAAPAVGPAAMSRRDASWWETQQGRAHSRRAMHVTVQCWGARDGERGSHAIGTKQQ